MHYDQLGFISEIQEWFKLCGPVHAIKITKDQNYMLIFSRYRKHIQKQLTSFRGKHSQKN